MFALFLLLEDESNPVIWYLVYRHIRRQSVSQLLLLLVYSAAVLLLLCILCYLIPLLLEPALFLKSPDLKKKQVAGGLRNINLVKTNINYALMFAMGTNNI